MTATIRATPPELQAKASDIDRNAEIVKREVAQITTLVNNMRKTFLGETASVFFKEFDSALRDMDQWDDVVKSFATEIRDAAVKLQRADQSHH